MAEKFHDDWEVVPFNLNMELAEDPTPVLSSWPTQSNS